MSEKYSPELVEKYLKELKKKIPRPRFTLIRKCNITVFIFRL